MGTSVFVKEPFENIVDLVQRFMKHVFSFSLVE